MENEVGRDDIFPLPPSQGSPTRRQTQRLTSARGTLPTFATKSQPHVSFACPRIKTFSKNPWTTRPQPFVPGPVCIPSWRCKGVKK